MFEYCKLEKKLEIYTSIFLLAVFTQHISALSYSSNPPDNEPVTEMSVEFTRRVTEELNRTLQQIIFRITDRGNIEGTVLNY